MSDKLNRKKPFGEVFGSSTLRYFQDGKYYDHSGNLYSVDQSSPSDPEPEKDVKEISKATLTRENAKQILAAKEALDRILLDKKLKKLEEERNAGGRA